jgi:hypothetical protein
MNAVLAIPQRVSEKRIRTVTRFVQKSVVQENPSLYHSPVRRFRVIPNAAGRLAVEIETHATDPESFSGCQMTLPKWMDGLPVRLSLTRHLRVSHLGKHHFFDAQQRQHPIGCGERSNVSSPMTVPIFGPRAKVDRHSLR